jgi:hypothetical protein
MKVKLHYVPNHCESTLLAERAFRSFLDNCWDVQLVEGYTHQNIPDPHTHWYMIGGRLHELLRSRSPNFSTKLAIVSNHIRFWQSVVESNQTAIYAEHDVVCNQPYFDLPEFEDILLLNLDKTNMDNHLLEWVYCIPTDFKMKEYSEGVHNLPDDWPWIYNLHDTIYKNAKLVPGAGCYAITPAGAKKLLNAINVHGLEQGDLNMNSFNVDIKFNIPALVEFRPGAPLTKSLWGSYS